MRLQVAPAEGSPQTAWIPMARVAPGMMNGVRGRTARIRHAANGQVMATIVGGRPAIDHAATATRRDAIRVNKRGIGFGIVMAGPALEPPGPVVGR